jgi:hypothetical protein
LILVAASPGGCASDSRYEQGLERVGWNEQEKKRLNAPGFRQYNWY